MMRIDPSAINQQEAPLYEMKRGHDSRMAGTVPVYRAGSFKFSDFVDVVNPLQHLPFIGGVYRQATGDTISPAAEVMGGAVFGGPIGAAASAMSRTISDDMAVKENPALALNANRQEHTKDISIVIDETLSGLSGTTVAHADLRGKSTPTYLHNTRHYNE